MKPFLEALADRLFREKYVIGRSYDDAKYLSRWVVWGIRTSRETEPKPAIYLHQFHRSDADEMHDHPWSFLTIILWGGYWEKTPGPGWKNGDGPVKRRWYGPGRINYRPHGTIHSVEIPKGKFAVTLFFRGKRKSSWGFWCPRIGWRHWKEHSKHLEATGDGCGE